MGNPINAPSWPGEHEATHTCSSTVLSSSTPPPSVLDRQMMDHTLSMTVGSSLRCAAHVSHSPDPLLMTEMTKFLISSDTMGLPSVFIVAKSSFVATTITLAAGTVAAPLRMGAGHSRWTRRGGLDWRDGRLALLQPPPATGEGALFNFTAHSVVSRGGPSNSRAGLRGGHGIRFHETLAHLTLDVAHRTRCVRDEHRGGLVLRPHLLQHV